VLYFSHSPPRRVGCPMASLGLLDVVLTLFLLFSSCSADFVRVTVTVSDVDYALGCSLSEAIQSINSESDTGGCVRAAVVDAQVVDEVRFGVGVLEVNTPTVPARSVRAVGPVDIDYQGVQTAPLFYVDGVGFLSGTKQFAMDQVNFSHVATAAVSGVTDGSQAAFIVANGLTDFNITSSAFFDAKVTATETSSTVAGAVLVRDTVNVNINTAQFRGRDQRKSRHPLHHGWRALSLR